MLEQRFHTPLPLDLEIEIPSGDIEVETAEGEESYVRVDSGDERLLDEVEITHDGGRLRIVYRGRKRLGGLTIAVGSFSFGPEGLKVTARVPHGTSLKAKTASADTTVTGRLGALEINGVSGDLRVRGEISGDARLKTVSGDARIEQVGGALTAQTVSGDVQVGPVGGSSEVKTVSGDIRVDGVRSGDVRFTSISGDIEIGISAGSAVDVDAGSTSGDLSSEVPLGSEPVEASGDVPLVVVRGRTVSGDVRVFRAA